MKLLRMFATVGLLVAGPVLGAEAERTPYWMPEFDTTGMEMTVARFGDFQVEITGAAEGTGEVMIFLRVKNWTAEPIPAVFIMCSRGGVALPTRAVDLPAHPGAVETRLLVKRRDVIGTKGDLDCRVEAVWRRAEAAVSSR